MHDNATVVYSEMIVPGRVASGESFGMTYAILRL